MIIFVGDKPSAKNIDPDVPFVGTQSYKTLLGWIWKLDVNINDVTMTNIPDSHDELMAFAEHAVGSNNKVVTLGENASTFVKEFRCYPELDCFKLPHPSPKNRVLNNKKYVKSQLLKCKEWLSK